MLSFGKLERLYVLPLFAIFFGEMNKLFQERLGCPLVSRVISKGVLRALEVGCSLARLQAHDVWHPSLLLFLTLQPHHQNMSIS